MVRDERMEEQRECQIFEHQNTDYGKERADCWKRVIAIYTVSQKKQDSKLLPITSPNVNRFSKFFHCPTQWQICNKFLFKYPTTP